MYDSGCRVQEIIDFQVEHINLKGHSTILVHGKGDKYRVVPLLDKTKQIIQRYISKRKLSDSDFLFTNRQGQQLSRQGIAYVLNKYCAKARKKYPGEITCKVSPHTMRHSKATHLVNAGVNIYNIRDLLGHESVVTTEVYLTSNPEVTRKAIEEYSDMIVSASCDFYSKSEQNDLLEYLDSLI